MLEPVNKIILSKLTSEASALSDTARYLLELGGKRLRPKLCIEVFKMLKPNCEPSADVYKISAGIEMIHMATLLHDDIIDKSNLRRHQVSPRIKFGEDATLLSGDFLLVRAFGICSDFDQAIIRATEVACVELTEGEVLETPLSRDSHSLESYKNIAIKKTASLFRLACFCGAHLAGNSEHEKHWAHFGELLGLAYQMFDDIADAMLDQTELGKPSGLDLLERKPSLVNILWLSSGSPLAKEVLLTDSREAASKLTEAALTEIRGPSGPLKVALELAESTQSEAFNYLEKHVLSEAIELKDKLSEITGLFSTLTQMLRSKIN